MRRTRSEGRRYSPEQFANLVAVTEPWLSCDDCFEQLDTRVDALLEGAADLDDAFRVHLARCAACYEEAETLLTLAADDRDASQEHALQQLRNVIDPDRALPANPAPRHGKRQPLRRRRHGSPD